MIIGHKEYSCNNMRAISFFVCPGRRVAGVMMKMKRAAGWCTKATVAKVGL